MITTICYFFSFLAEAIVLWQYTCTLFIPKQRLRTRLLFLCALYLTLFAVSLFD